MAETQDTQRSVNGNVRYHGITQAHTMNAKLEAIGKKAAENLQAYIKEHEERILEAWDSVEQEAQDQEQAPKFNLGFAIKLDLDADTMETALTWSVKFRASSTAQIPDPNQMPLPGVEDDGFAEKANKFIEEAVVKSGATMTLSTEGKSVTIGPEEAKILKRAAKAMRKG